MYACLILIPPSSLYVVSHIRPLETKSHSYYEYINQPGWTRNQSGVDLQVGLGHVCVGFYRRGAVCKREILPGHVSAFVSYGIRVMFSEGNGSFCLSTLLLTLSGSRK